VWIPGAEVTASELRQCVPARKKPWSELAAVLIELATLAELRQAKRLASIAPAA